MAGEIHIYGLVDPRDRKIKYVGQTISPDRRLKEHIADTDSGTAKSDWINGMGHRKPSMVILDTVAQADANKVETWWILFCRYKGWQNVNGTNPGAWRADFGEMFSEDLERQYNEFVARLENAGSDTVTYEALRSTVKSFSGDMSSICIVISMSLIALWIPVDRMGVAGSDAENAILLISALASLAGVIMSYDIFSHIVCARLIDIKGKIS